MDILFPSGYKDRHVADLFQGWYKSTLVCPHCQAGSGYLAQTKGDALEIVATFSVAANVKATRFGLRLRQLGSFSCDVVVTRGAGGAWTYGVGPTSGWNGSLVPQPTTGTVTLQVFLDRSIVEVYTGGAALTERCMLPTAITERLRDSGVRPSEAAAGAAPWRAAVLPLCHECNARPGRTNGD